MNREVRAALLADYVRLYDGRGETPGQLRKSAPERFLTNPSLHAVYLMRRALASSPATFGLWRQLLLSKHSIDVERGASVGPGLRLPHPFGVILGSGVELGEDVMLYHNVTIGRAGHSEGPPPRIGDGVIVHTNAVITTGAEIGDGAVVGANSIVEGDVPPGSIVKMGRVEAPAGA